MLLPTTFPIEISAFPLIAALMLTAASGMDVPIATMVRPITICGILNLFAMLEAPSTKKSAPLAKNTKPRIKKSTLKKTDEKVIDKNGIKIEPPFFTNRDSKFIKNNKPYLRITQISLATKDNSFDMLPDFTRDDDNINAERRLLP